MRRLLDVADARRNRGGVGAAERDDLERLVQLEEPPDEAPDVAADAGRRR
jgi:hypothetical protein